MRFAVNGECSMNAPVQWPFSTRAACPDLCLVGTPPLPRVPDIRSRANCAIRLRRDIRRGISGNARQRVPTALESAVGCGFAGKTHSMVQCMDLLDPVAIQHTRSACPDLCLVGTPLPRVPDIRSRANCAIRLRRDIRRGISANARQRVPTASESAVGCGSAGKTHSYVPVQTSL